MLNHLKTWLRNRPIWQITLLVVFLIILMTLLGIWIFSQRSLNIKLEALRDQGLPTNLTEVNEYYSIPEGTIDSTELWLKAFDAIESAGLVALGKDLPFIGQGTRPKAGEKWDQFDKAKQLVNDFNSKLKLIHEAAEAGGQIRFPFDFTLMSLDTMKTLNKVRNAASFLSLAVEVSVYSGDCESAMKCTQSLLLLTNALQNEVSTLSVLTNNALFAIGVDRLELILSECYLSDAQLRNLQELIMGVDFRDSITRALVAERAFNLTSVEMVSLPTLKTANKLYVLNHFEKIFATFDKPWIASLQLLKQCDQKFANRLSGTVISYPIFTATYLTGWHKIFIHSSMEVSARQRCINATLAAKRFQLMNGSFPQSLVEIPHDLLTPDEFSQELLIDPFDGKPLRFKLKENRLLIYSVGENQIDDGGACPRGDGGTGLDIGFWLTLSN